MLQETRLRSQKIQEEMEITEQAYLDRVREKAEIEAERQLRKLRRGAPESSECTPNQASPQMGSPSSKRGFGR